MNESAAATRTTREWEPESCSAATAVVRDARAARPRRVATTADDGTTGTLHAEGRSCGIPEDSVDTNRFRRRGADPMVDPDADGVESAPRATAPASSEHDQDNT